MSYSLSAERVQRCLLPLVTGLLGLGLVIRPAVPQGAGVYGAGERNRPEITLPNDPAAQPSMVLRLTPFPPLIDTPTLLA
jgi:hypothetical protein